MLVPLSPQKVLANQGKLQSKVEIKGKKGKVKGRTDEGQVERTFERPCEKSGHKGKKIGKFLREKNEEMLSKKKECFMEKTLI